MNNIVFSKKHRVSSGQCVTVLCEMELEDKFCEEGKKRGLNFEYNAHQGNKGGEDMRDQMLRLKFLPQDEFLSFVEGLKGINPAIFVQHA